MESKGRLHDWSRRGIEIGRLPILDNGTCERFKAGVHAVTLGLAAVMGAYNFAAWLRRREDHLAINALIYSLAVVWERAHVAHHLRSLPLPVTEEAVLVEDPLSLAVAEPLQAPASEAA